VDDAKDWNKKECESYLDHMSLQLDVNLKTKKLSDQKLNEFVDNPVDIITDLKLKVENMNLPGNSPYVGTITSDKFQQQQKHTNA
jgi:hypothetical protein